MIGTRMVVAATLLLSACGGDAGQATEQPFEWPDHLSPLLPEYVLGEPAPAFELPTLTATAVGEDTVGLEELRGRVVVLSFWNTGCAPCVAEHGTLNAAAERYERDGVRFLGINDLDTPASLAAFEAEHGPGHYPQLSDRGDRVGAAYSRWGWPLHVVIGRDGRVAWRHRGGPIKREVLEEVIGAVLEGRRPESPTSAVYREPQQRGMQ